MRPTAADRLLLRERPAAPVVMHQRWRALLFAHWRIDPDAIQKTLPVGLHVDTCDGSAWLGVVPFFMDAVRPAFLPALPWLSWFQELNVRTYVHDEKGVPGVWFYSLDCNQPLAVAIARTLFHLNYRHAAMPPCRHVLAPCARRHPIPKPTARNQPHRFVPLCTQRAGCRGG